MTFSAPGRRRRFFPELTSLEPRSLLTAVVTCLGQDGHDLVGPDASQGPDGIQDLHFQLSGLAGAVNQIVVQGPPGFEWATEPDPTGAALAEYFPGSTPGQGDLYLNPQVKSDLPSSGMALPLGGSTGNLIQLANGMLLTFNIDYQGQTSPDTATVNVSNLVSATDPMPPLGTPGNIVSSFRVTDDGQDGSGQPYEQGFVHLAVAAPEGVAFDNSTFSQVLWQLSDPAGLAWDSTVASLGHNHVYATLRPDTTNVVDIYFPPARDEAPESGSTTPTMLLQVSIPNDSNVYVTPFMGADWNLSALTAPFDGAAAPIPAPTTEDQLRGDLMSVSPEYDTIDLPANTTITITQPLEITHSVTIVGNNATLFFQQGDTAPWPATASGAIYVDAPAYHNIQLKLDDLTIKFDMSSPIRWSNPPGTTPALFDPENNPAGSQHAVIDTGDSNINLNSTILTLNNIQIYGPPAFDGSSYGSLQAQLAQGGDTLDQYVGEQDMSVVRTNGPDSGTISNSTFLGGTINVTGGPWNITGNTVLGSVAASFSPGAFGLQSPHDVLLKGNQVTQSIAGGLEFRLVVLAGSGFDNTIEDNSFGGGGGQLGNELSYNSGAGQFVGINDPEVILAESGYGVLFEGRPGPISSDGRLLILPNVRAYAFPVTTGPGLVVSILAGVNADGTPNMSLAGQWFRVAQQVSLSSTNTVELLMEDRLPPMPHGGYYVVEVTSGFVDNAFVNNTLNLSGKSSTGIVLNGEDFGTSIIGNDLIGGTIYETVYTGAAISLGASLYAAPSGNGAFPLPAGWTALPNLGAVVQDNTIEDSLGGIMIGVQHAVNYWQDQVETTSETGRVFVTASVTNNTFEYDSSFLGSWANAYAADGNNPAQNSTPPTITIGGGFSAEAPGPYGNPRFPWTVGNAIKVNSSNVPIFVDPAENDITVESNSVKSIASNGTVTVESGLSGQVYAAVVNGVTVSPTISPETYNNQPYYPFNLDNLNIGTAPPSPPPSGPPQPPPSSRPPAPTGLHAVLAGLNLISLSWNSAAGASNYILERSLDGSTWSAIATNLTATSFMDSGLNYSTTYYYYVLAVSSAGTSSASPIVSAETLAQPDILSGRSLIMNLSRGVSFTGPVATFTDANAATTAGRLIATISWGDRRFSIGQVEGGNGTFTVSGTHAFATVGVFAVKVTVTMTVPEVAGIVVTSTAKVGNPPKSRASLRHRPSHRVERKFIEAAPKRARKV